MSHGTSSAECCSLVINDNQDDREAGKSEIRLLSGLLTCVAANLLISRWE
jgi:hypothetical protein